MLDPRNSHAAADNTSFHLFDPFQAITQTPDRHDDEVDFELKLLKSDKDDESGIQSPPLWKNNNNNSPIVYPLSPNSRRREAIVKGQKELMEMVKNLPESCYELSLKDLVEHVPRPKQSQNQQEYLLQQRNDDDDDDDHDRLQSNRQLGGSKKFDKKRGYGGVENNNNNNKGMLLKMVFPVGNRSSTRKSVVRFNSSSSSSSNKYWWKSDSSSRSSIHSRSSSSNSNSNSTSSTSTRERRRMLPNCMACFQSSKNQGAE